MSLIPDEIRPPVKAHPSDPALEARRLREGLQCAKDWLAAFDRSVSSGDLQALGLLFHTDSYWRDMLAFQWDFRTYSGRDRIVQAWRKALALHRVHDIRIEDAKVGCLTDGTMVSRSRPSSPLQRQLAGAAATCDYSSPWARAVRGRVGPSLPA